MRLIHINERSLCPIDATGRDVHGECMGACDRDVKYWQHTPAATELAAQNRVKHQQTWNAANAPSYGYTLPRWIVNWVGK